MGCDVTIGLDNISLGCGDIPVGGIKEVYIASACKVALGLQDKVEVGGSANADFGKATTIGFEGSETPHSGELFMLEFNKRDGVTAFTDAKTVDASGIITVVPTLTLELPKMTNSKRNILNELSSGVGKFVVFLGTTAGTYHVLGGKFGMKVSEISGTTGTGRTEKNAYTLTLVGEETELAYDCTDLWEANVKGKASVSDPAATNVDYTKDTDAYIPRKNCIPKVTA